MKSITETEVEEFAIELLQDSGYDYLNGPEITPDGSCPERGSYGDVILVNRLQHAIEKLNPEIPSPVREQALKNVHRLPSLDLISNNEAFHKMLTDGIEVEYRHDGDIKGDNAWLIDFEHAENNEFLVVNQFTVIENNINKRPDLVLFINGLPLIVMELKNPADENATVRKAFDQLQTYKAYIPSLFHYNTLLIASDGYEARAGSLTAGFSRFMAWKSIDGTREESPLINQLEILIKGLLNKRTILDLIRHFTVFEKTKKEDPKTGLSTVVTEKKIAGYHQYFAVNKAIESTFGIKSVEK